MSVPESPKIAAVPSDESTAPSSGARPDASGREAFAGYSAEGEAEPDGSDVIVHIYHCDPWTGYLNGLWLKSQGIPIYHLGVEVFGEELSFLYFEDSWDDESVSGVMRCRPKNMAEYIYQESMNLGRTPLSEAEVDEVLLRLSFEYPACSYHLTRRNCLTFAHDLVGILQPPLPFPQGLKGIVDAASRAPRLDATVDYGWSWAKWYMLRKHQAPNEETGPEQSGGYFCCSHAGAERQSSMWTLLLEPGSVCTGNSASSQARRIEGDTAISTPHDLQDGMPPNLIEPGQPLRA